MGSSVHCDLNTFTAIANPFAKRGDCGNTLSFLRRPVPSSGTCMGWVDDDNDVSKFRSLTRKKKFEKDSTIWLSEKEAKKTKTEGAKSIAETLSKYLSNSEEKKSGVAEEINQTVETGSNIQIIDIETANIEFLSFNDAAHWPIRESRTHPVRPAHGLRIMDFGPPYPSHEENYKN
ncbi:hypothetical protein EVAR_47835_1 [Eumeta japonica]|uniref:Uncharacterized protein n=1 Tax=Eumeta variegata TaxID=151549 RepID=A0A4C1XWD2_EUMVA|nr:hypothetical protein EVAR_47835_1 [Eumeta japonica]